MKANAKALLGISVALALVAGPLPAGFGPTPEKGDTPPTIVVFADRPLGPISPLLRGANHRYHDCGTGAWDPSMRAPVAQVVEAARASGITVLRFPGGTVGSPYHWTDGIGPVEGRPPSISGFTGEPVANDYGFDEHMVLCEEIGATTTVVVNFGSGTAQEAAAWVAYANGDPADTRSIGVDRLGRDWRTVGYWAALREENQRRLGREPHPYHIRYWEVGNELYGSWEFTWTHDSIRYAFGGTEWHQDEPVGKARDWRGRAARSDGTPGQVFYLRYPPLVLGTERITVDGKPWRRVKELALAGPRDRVYQLDPRTGELRFGDGVHGRIPPRGAEIRAGYESGPHDGFVDFYRAMKEVDPSIEVGSCFASEEFLAAMGSEHPYDFVVIHIYGKPPRHVPDLEALHRWTVASPLLFEVWLERARARIDAHAGKRASEVELSVTEYNPILRFRDPRWPRFRNSLSQALAVADLLRVFIEHGITLAQLHCLTSEGGGGMLTPSPDHLRQSEAYALELYSHLDGERVESSIEGGPCYTISYRGVPYEIPYFEAIAALDPSEAKLALLVINKHPTEALAAEIKIQGFVPRAQATAYTLNGPSLDAFNFPKHPTAVRISQTVFAEAAKTFPYTFPAHSVTLIELRR